MKPNLSAFFPFFPQTSSSVAGTGGNKTPPPPALSAPTQKVIDKALSAKHFGTLLKLTATLESQKRQSRKYFLSQVADAKNQLKAYSDNPSIENKNAFLRAYEKITLLEDSNVVSPLPSQCEEESSQNARRSKFTEELSTAYTRLRNEPSVAD